MNDGEVTSVVFPTNTPSVSGDDITLSPLKNASKNVVYRVVVVFTSVGNKLSKTFYVHGV